MELPRGLGQLTYCLNIHPTQSWAEARAALTGPVKAVKARVSPDAPFAVGLRFSAETVEELQDPAKLAELKDIIAANDYLPITMNGFPYGPFHGTRVKEDVYLPDWRADERVDYTIALADLMADINPEGAQISLSTVPGAFKPLGLGAEAEMAANIHRVVAHLIDLEARTGRCVALAIEPEPFCFLETIDEAVRFFLDHLYSDAGAARLAKSIGKSSMAAMKALHRHVGLCYDVCHAAVEFEDAAESIAMLRRSNVPVHKLQLSSALRVASGDDAAREALGAFNEPTYLHQLVAKGPNGLTRFSDLSEALGPGGAKDGEEWRVHFHVPVFLETLPEFETTQSFLAEILELHRAAPISTHLEVETYTWDVLPDGVAAGSVDEAVARELAWVKDRLT